MFDDYIHWTGIYGDVHICESLSCAACPSNRLFCDYYILFLFFCGLTSLGQIVWQEDLKGFSCSPSRDESIAISPRDCMIQSMWISSFIYVYAYRLHTYGEAQSGSLQNQIQKCVCALTYWLEIFWAWCIRQAARISRGLYCNVWVAACTRE